MAYKVVVTETAEQDIDAILAYMMGNLDNVSAAVSFADDVADKYDHLEENPYMYEESRDARLKKQGYRRIPIGNYVMLYLVDDDKQAVFISRVFYGKQEYTKLI